ncbi:hypothetical protein D3C72_1600070 [compost metagenome]
MQPAQEVLDILRLVGEAVDVEQGMVGDARRAQVIAQAGAGQVSGQQQRQLRGALAGGAAMPEQEAERLRVAAQYLAADGSIQRRERNIRLRHRQGGHIPPLCQAAPRLPQLSPNARPERQLPAEQEVQGSFGGFFGRKQNISRAIHTILVEPTTRPRIATAILLL